MNTQTHIECRSCGVLKPIEAFRRWTKSAGNGRPYRLKTCAECHRVKAGERHKQWRDANREHVKVYSREQQRKRRANMSEADKSAYDAKAASRAVARRERMKAAVYLAYGGAICACCGETEPLFLSIDHVNNDGYKLRKEGQGVGEPFMRWLIKNGFPPGYQILCMNCNHGKSRNNGVCPHELEKVQRLERKLVGPSGPKRPALRCDGI